MAGARWTRSYSALLALAFFWLLMLAGCAPPREAPARELAGEIAVLSASGVRQPLSQVAVHVYDEATMVPLLKELRRTAEAELAVRQALFLDMLAFEQQQLAISEEASRKAEQAHEIASRTPGRAKAEWQAAAAASRRSLDAAAAHEAASARASEALAEVNAVRSASFIFQHLPPSTYSTVTDRAGRFSLKLPAKQRTALAASARYTVNGKERPLFWLLWVDWKDQMNVQVVLDDSNLLERQPAQAVIDWRTWLAPPASQAARREMPISDTILR